MGRRAPRHNRPSRWHCRASRVIRSRRNASSFTIFCPALAFSFALVGTVACKKDEPAPAPAAKKEEPAKKEEAKKEETKKDEAKKEEPKESKTPLFLQAGSFSTAQDADNQKAKLAFMGVEAVIQQVMIQDKTLFRVRVGPYSKIDELNKVRAELAKAGIEAQLSR